MKAAQKRLIFTCVTDEDVMAEEEHPGDFFYPVTVNVEVIKAIACKDKCVETGVSFILMIHTD